MKKNIRKIPKSVLQKLKLIGSNEVIVACAKKFTDGELKAGILENMDVFMTDQGLCVPQAKVPPASQGRFSAQNVNGVTIVRRDLPKETHYHTVEAPNYGDSWKGTHSVDLPHQEYPREFKPPRELEITMECANTREGLAAYVVAFKVNEVLKRDSSDFKERLFENLNLLQENIGSCGIERADKSLSDFVKELHVSWEILPPGSKDEVLARLFMGRKPSSEERGVAADRYSFFISLKAKKLVYGTSGLRRYFGALLEDNLVVFENIEYGNAIYLLYEDWEELSTKSRLELLSGRCGSNFDRVVHRAGWKTEVRALVAAKRQE